MMWSPKAWASPPDCWITTSIRQCAQSLVASTDAYRRLIEIETKISHPTTAKMLQEIKDPDIRALESIMFARALLGLPMKRVTVAEKNKEGNRVRNSDGN